MRATCGLRLKDGEGVKDLMLVLLLDETIDQLATVNSVY